MTLLAGHSTRKWLEIIASGPKARKDEAATALIDAGSPAVVELEPVPAAIGPEKAALMAHLLPSPSLSESPTGRLAECLKGIGWGFTASAYKNRDWSTAWKSGIRATRVTVAGRSVVVRPTWKKKSEKPGDVVVEIDPSMAFGTGSHESTRLCLKAMLSLRAYKSLKPADTRVLDVGTGSGVLAIAAVKLGFGSATGTDIDRTATKIARKNARLNKTIVSLSAKPVEEIRGTFQLIVANILSGVLISMAPALYKKLAPGGYLVLSGLLRKDSASVDRVFRETGLVPFKTYSLREWTSLIYERKGNA